MRGLMNGRVLAPVHALVYGIMYALVLLGVHACMHALMNARALTGGLVCASVVLVWHAGVEAGPERQAAVRVFGEVFGEQEGRGAGGHQVPPVSNALLRLEPLLLHHKQNIQSLCNVGVFEFFPPRAYHVQIDHLDHLHIVTCLYEVFVGFVLVLIVHIKPRTHVLDHADYTTLAREHELLIDHTDHTDHEV